MKLPKCSVLLLCLSAIASLSSAQISISGVLDSETYYHRAYEDIYGDAESTSEISEDNPGVFNYTFNSFGETTVTITWSAPEGQVFVVDAPEDWGTAYISMSFSGGSSGASSGAFYDSTNTPVFNDLTGSFSLVGSSVNLTGPSAPDNRANFSINAYANIAAGSSVSFSSVSLTAVVSSYSGAFSNVPVGSFKLRGHLFSDSDPADPGTWAYLAAAPVSAVPEPSTYAALLGGIALVVTAGRRRRRRN